MSSFLADTTYSYLGISYGNIAESKKAFNKSIEINPEIAQFYYNRSVLYSNIGEIDKMLKDLEQVIILDPTHTSALNNLGFHYLNIEKEYDKAVYYLTEIINLKYDANAYYNRAKAFQFLKKYSEAISDINLIIKNEGEDKQLL
ncbi:tetratricopeptide repeat protein [Brumimicrobium glaciale]|uniref:Tetratricopeptide repeat protein n=1 Tax=Brumimicrobium glaciale TaxID=200475 RepID=A0A4Q4KIX5_9FLAO|nr:tetratricopeptide repeat protein [Brumimicrobium glaciale]RYM32617.1 tetratricopeptide repeat protein [Brumimicrobium glaciale]